MLHEIIHLGIGDCSLCGNEGKIRVYKVSPDKSYTGNISREDLLIFNLCTDCRESIRVVAEADNNDECRFSVIAQLCRFQPLKQKEKQLSYEKVCLNVRLRLPPDYWDDDEDDFEQPDGSDDPTPVLTGGRTKSWT